ncbi:hypothetical protein MNBD_GAMMA21-2385 [hydrothermal vent metagenome]|uniref:Rhodanese domain-containing protein n=1 Tax=hydrothermal vent metagenome TaxID=652676 RepID=A0A3B1A719_9ZZZZ
MRNIFLTRRVAVVTMLMTVFYAGAVCALDVKITQQLPHFQIKHAGQDVVVQRVQDQENKLIGGFSKTSRKCPPFCIQPMKVLDGVSTAGELEVIDFLRHNVAAGSGVLIDARTPSWHARGTIPGSINIPFTLFSLKESDTRLIKAMSKLGVKPWVVPPSDGMWAYIKEKTGIEKRPHPYWDFSGAKDIVLWCNGMWCGQSPRAIKGLVRNGYPVDKIHYYRGGMQGWKILGLTVVVP